MVDERGYDGRQKDAIVTFVDGAQRFEAHLSQFFADSDLLVTLTSCSGT